MDVLRGLNMTVEGAENEEAKKYWGVIREHGDKPGPDPWTCLGLALYDLLRATTRAPPTRMSAAGAKTYATPEMMVKCKALLGIDAGFSRDEAAYLDVHTVDQLLTLEFRTWKFEMDMSTREGGPEAGMPYVTRKGFLTFFIYSAILHPEPVRQRVNAIIEDQNIYLVDPLTNERFPHPIPTYSLESSFRPTLLQANAKIEAVNNPRIAKLMEDRRAAAVASGEMRQLAPGDRNFATSEFYDSAREEAAAEVAMVETSALASMNLAAQNAISIQTQPSSEKCGGNVGGECKFLGVGASRNGCEQWKRSSE